MLQFLCNQGYFVSRTNKSKQKTSRRSREVEEVSIAPEERSALRPETVRGIWATLLFVVALITVLAAFGGAGNVGAFLYGKVFRPFFGFGIVMLPIFLVVFGVLLLRPIRMKMEWYEGASGALLFVSVLGLLHLLAPDIRGGGWLGKLVGGGLASGFDIPGAALILIALSLIGFLVLFNEELRIPSFVKDLISRIRNRNTEESYEDEEYFQEEIEEEVVEEVIPASLDEEEPVPTPKQEQKKLVIEEDEEMEVIAPRRKVASSYVMPPLSLLGKTSGKPSIGDVKANQNIIKRTLQNFGIDVEMDEVSVGPTVTRYALKPAEGVKLARIVGLRQDLSMALAAHPIRIEAPIPGKSLVGIEIPNRVKATVGLGSLLEDKQFQDGAKRLLVALGKGVTGFAKFTDLAKMPHLLIAGTTGSGKSVTVHNLIMSLLYRNGPDDLRFIMVDPKRVELTLYNNIPHLLTPVIKEPKKAILALKWAAKEMERRYDILESHSVRDIGSYHKSVSEPYYAKKKNDAEDTDAPEKMPYIVILIDELADIMQAYPRELESAIVRLAQMSRATGIHLVLSTQRPSVNVITGLIKANIPARLALQVASQIDSRTILDQPGAETLLGAGDMLYMGGDMSKPERMQCAYIAEDEIKTVVSFIKKNNEVSLDEITFGGESDEGNMVSASFDDDEDDDMYEEARRTVIETGKASTSYLQRKLKIGYSRAARMMDILEERGVVGPADGAKPREVLGGSSASNNSGDEV